MQIIFFSESVTIVWTINKWTVVHIYKHVLHNVFNKQIINYNQPFKKIAI